MKEKETKKQQKVEEERPEVVSKTEQFFRTYAKALSISVGVIIVVALAVVLWNRYVYQPKKVEAQEQMYPAESTFRLEEYELALYGDGNILGFSQIIDDYGAKAGKSVYLYAGICQLQLGNYEDAISCLRKYKGKDHILLGRAQSCIGDAYVGLEDYSRAVSWFEKAAKTSKDMYSAAYLLKAGVTCEELGEYDHALKCYNEIKLKYPQSIEGYDIDKYILRIEARQD